MDVAYSVVKSDSALPICREMIHIFSGEEPLT